MSRRHSRAAKRGASVRPRRSLRPTFEWLEPRHVLDATVVINEIMYHPDAAPEANFEWIELYNEMSINMDISGWRLEGAIQYTFAEGSVIPGRGYQVIASSPTSLAGAGITSSAIGPFTGRLDNAGEEIVLVNRDGRRMSVVDYGEGGEWPAGPDGSGFSLAKLDQYSDSSNPASWRASRQVNGTPGAANFPIGADAGPALVFNEIPAATGSGFWVEIANQGTSSINLSGYQLRTSGGVGATYTFGAQSIGAGQVLVVDQATMGFGAAAGDKLFLYSPSKDRLLDARAVTGRVQGLAAAYGSEWLYPSAATPGAANVFQLNSDIVINEIMYHAMPNYPTTGVSNTSKLVGIDATTQWRYNQAGTDLGASWATTAHPANGATWFQGPGVLAFETAPLPAVFSTFPIRTTLNSPGSTITTYYETDFTFSGNLSDVVSLGLAHIVDDGAVFYLNGVEVFRTNLPSGAISASTPAISGVESAYVGTISIPKTALVVGVNRLSVEVHQVASTTDVVMGAELFVTTSPVATVPFTESPEEWFELYNKGASAIDVSGWKVGGGITYTIPGGTTIPAGGYLVIAKDAASLQAKYPGATIVGGFSGSLSNSSDSIELLDGFGNPVDEVRYYDSANWHGEADGGGSSLELRNPQMDNTKAEAWGASDESAKSDWHTYTYTQVAGADTGPDQWNEFLFGFIESGAVLIDDVSVIVNPGTGTAAQLIQNGSFQSDALNSVPAKWRIIGNHSGTVVADPESPTNRVLQLVATGRTDHEGNNAGTTLAGNVDVVNGKIYQISFKAKWLSGSPQINSRLYLNRVSDTIAIDVPHDKGTPGAQNSNFVANAGPTYSELKHGPVLPAAGQAVTISVRAADPNGIASMTLFYSVEGSTFSSTTMTLQPDGRYAGTVPGQATGASVQFYVEGQDTLGATSTFPAAGANSRAMYEVNDTVGPTTAVDSIRIVAKSTEAAGLLVNTNLMSNQNIGATIIYNNRDVFYDVGIRLKGSSASRGDPVWSGSYAIEFNADQLFRGVYDEISLDSSGRGSGASGGQQQVQMLVNQILNHAGNGLPSTYEDFAFVISPNTAHTGMDALQLSRYSNDFLDETYANGSEGNLYEYEIVYYSNSTTNGNVEGPKIQTMAGHLDAPPTDRGDDADAYRWNFILKNNRDAQEYSQIIAMNKAFDLTGTAFINAITPIIDVDQWLRTFAAATVMGIADTYATFGNYHNLSFYVRPSDNKVLMMPWDWDEAFRLSATSTIIRGASDEALQKLLNTTNMHSYLSHLYDLVTNEFTTSYMSSWVTHFQQLGQQDASFANQINYISTRRTSVINQINALVPSSTQFNITTNNGNPLSIATPTVTLSGTGYVDFHEIRLRGSTGALPLTWTSNSTWQVVVPLNTGANSVVLDAYDVRGNLVQTDSISVTTSAVTSTPLNSLRITEMNYHPADPPPGSAITDSEEYEFIELTNIGSDPIFMQNVAFTTGITFTFPAMTLNPGQHVVLAKNADAFAARYGSSISIAGVYSGNLNNSGERLVLVNSIGQTILDFTYLDDDWIPAADGPGYSMVIVNSGAATSAWGTAANWRRSANVNGSPGAADTPYVDGDYNRNGTVDAADFVMWRKALGTSVTIFTGADGDGNGFVDQGDYAVWRAHFGEVAAAVGSGASVELGVGAEDASGEARAASVVALVQAVDVAGAAQALAEAVVFGGGAELWVDLQGDSGGGTAGRVSSGTHHGWRGAWREGTAESDAVVDRALVAWLASRRESVAVESGANNGRARSDCDIEVGEVLDEVDAAMDELLEYLPRSNWRNSM